MKATAFRRVLDDLLSLAPRLPCWGWLLCAAAAYSLHLIASLEVPAPTATLDVVTLALLQLTVTLARTGQTLLPLAFLAAAAVCGFDRFRRAELRQSVAQDTSGSVLRGLSWPDFQLLVGDVFRRQGYELVSAGSGGRPGNRQFGLRRGGRHILVDCSDWRSSNATGAALLGLHERMQGSGADQGFAVTSGHFTQEAKHFAAAKDIELIDGRRLKALVRAELRPPEGTRVFPDPKRVLAAGRELVARVRRGLEAARAAATSGLRSPGTRAARADQRAREPGVDADLESTARRLTALIRAQAHGAGTHAGARKVSRGPRARWLPPPRILRPQWPKIRFPRVRVRGRRIADAVGILVSLALLWAANEWFLGLPDTPAATPWALLGSGSDSEQLARRLEGVARVGPADRIPEGDRSLGQFRFGPAPGYLTRSPPAEPAAPGSAPIASTAPAEPVVTYGSLRELEAAFDVKYVPPPECYGGDSPGLLVKCGNHRIRARRAFVASGGVVSGMVLGSWDEPAPIPSGEWRRWGSDGEARPEASARLDEAEGAWDYSDEAVRDVRQDAQTPSAADGDWQRAWIEPARDSRPDWREEWSDSALQSAPSRGRDPDPDRAWRREWTPAQDRDQNRDQAPDQTQGWRQEWSREQQARDRTQDWRQEWTRVQQPAQAQDPDRDWRREWSQRGGGYQEPAYRPEYQEPIPIERRHWVDDL